MHAMEFIEAPAFTRHVSRYLADDAYRALHWNWPVTQSSVI